MDKKSEPSEVVKQIGALAEMSHIFYRAMIDVGATKKEAECGMGYFIAAHFMQPPKCNEQEDCDESH